MVAVHARRPVVGLTCYVEPASCPGRFDAISSLVPHAYVDAITAGGSRCVILPPDDDTDVLDRLDGVVLAGGPDVDPRRYGAAAHPSTDLPREARDGAEIAIVRAAIDRDLPLLGICRGMQIMAVACGGTLIQHLPDVLGTDLHRAGPGEYRRHAARFEPGSLAAQILGEAAIVPNSHHQAVHEPGALVTTGWAEDGTIESLEEPSCRFALGVQWHPEVDDDLRLFEGLTAAADGRRGSR